MTGPIRLNIGAGDSPLPGYDNSYDLKQGKGAYPLDLPDNSVDEIRASHVLEHIADAFVQRTLKECVRVLKPGGLLKIAVPDFEVICDKYKRGERGQYQGWIYGGQLDQHDVHFVLFDFDRLSTHLRAAGLVGIHYWGMPGAQDPDSSQLEVSLNLAGYKRPLAWPLTQGAMSRPRLGWQDHFGCALEALMPLGIGLFSRSGAYWGVAMSKAIEAAVEGGTQYVLSMDYDTVFTGDDVEDLLACMEANPEADALVPVQMGREDDKILINVAPKNGRQDVELDDLDKTYMPIDTGHFGLTLFRVSALQRLPKPWFRHSFNPDGSYHNHEDIEFWLAFKAAGLKAFLAPRVVVGHLEVVVLWPDRLMKTIYQRTSNYHDNGKPRLVWR